MQISAYIYAIECTANGMRYIGSTLDFQKRKTAHIARLRQCTHYNKALQTDWLHYGSSVFQFTILEKIVVDHKRSIRYHQLLKREQEYFTKTPNLYNTINAYIPEQARDGRRKKEPVPEHIEYFPHQILLIPILKALTTQDN